MFFQKIDLGVEGKAVDGGVDLPAPLMGVGDSLRELFETELFARSDAQGEVADPSVDGIGPVIDGDFQLFEVPRGGEEFYVFHNGPFFLIDGFSAADRERRSCGILAE
jgi:hypothetical protein